MIEVDRTPPTATRDERVAEIRELLADLSVVARGSRYEVNYRSELARLEAGGEPGPPATETKTFDLRSLQDLDGWQFRQPRGGPTFDDLQPTAVQEGVSP